MMLQGKVRWFNDLKGYGFISRDGFKDVFVHRSNISGSGTKSLSAGDCVVFELSEGRKGPEAVEVRPV